VIGFRNGVIGGSGAAADMQTNRLVENDMVLPRNISSYATK
jgi:hypothetical protein